MFIINTHQYVGLSNCDYVTYLIKQYMSVLTNWYKGSTSSFDSPGLLNYHPKAIERERRDQSTLDQDHNHSIFDDEMKIPAKWREILRLSKLQKIISNIII